MDKTSGQFYAVYGNTYQCMSSEPMLEQTWGTGELIDQLAAMQAMQDFQDQCHYLTSHSQQHVLHATNKMTPSPRNQHLRLSSTNHHLSTLIDQPCI